jgi:hypothetical protein
VTFGTSARLDQINGLHVAKDMTEIDRESRHLAAIELAVPRDAARGARFPERAMADLDSEP